MLRSIRQRRPPRFCLGCDQPPARLEENRFRFERTQSTLAADSSREFVQAANSSASMGSTGAWVAQCCCATPGACGVGPPSPILGRLSCRHMDEFYLGMDLAITSHRIRAIAHPASGGTGQTTLLSDLSAASPCRDVDSAPCLALRHRRCPYHGGGNSGRMRRPNSAYFLFVFYR